MSTKHVRTVGDLVRFRCGLQVNCACGRRELFDGIDVAKVFGNSALADVRRRLKCEQCGGKDVRIAVMEPPPKR